MSQDSLIGSTISTRPQKNISCASKISAFTELVLLGQKTWSDDEIKKRRFIQNAHNIGLVDTAFEELASDKSFIET